MIRFNSDRLKGIFAEVCDRLNEEFPHWKWKTTNTHYYVGEGFFEIWASYQLHINDRGEWCYQGYATASSVEVYSMGGTPANAVCNAVRELLIKLRTEEK